MAETVKVAGCPGTTNVSETGWPVITAGSTAEGGREGGREEGREGGREGGYKRDYCKYAIQTVDLSNLHFHPFRDILFTTTQLSLAG